MATTLTRHVTRLPAILLVVCLCWGVTLGQGQASSAAPEGAGNSTLLTPSNTSTPAPSVIEGNQDAGMAAQNQTEPAKTSTTTVQTTLSTTALVTPTTTSPLTSTVMSTLSSTVASTTPTTVTTTVSSTMMESTSTVSPTTTVSSTTPSTTIATSTTPSTTMTSTAPSVPETMSSTTSSTTMPSTPPSTTMSSTTPSTTMESTTPSTTMESTSPSTTMASTPPSTTMSSTTPSTTMASTPPSTTMSSTTPSTTMPSTPPSTTMESTSPSTTMPSTSPSTTMSSTTPSTTMESTLPSTTMPSTPPSTTMSPTAPPSTLDPTAANSTETTNSTEAPVRIPGGIVGGGTSTAATVPQTEFKTASMKPMVTDTTTPAPLASSTGRPVATGVPGGVATAGPVSVDNTTAVGARTTAPIIRSKTSGPTVLRSQPPFMHTTQYSDTGSATGAIRTTQRPDIATDRMTAKQSPRMTQIMSTAAMLPVRTSQLRTTPMPISTSAYDHSRDQTSSDMPSSRSRVTTAVPVIIPAVSIMTTAPRTVRTTKITQPTTIRKVTTTLPTLPVLRTTEVPEITKDVTYSIRFEGDCSIILRDASVREKFEQNFIDMYSDKLSVPRDNILIQDISCGSVDVMFTLKGIQQSKVEKRLEAATSQPVPLVVNADGQTYAFNPISYNLDDPSRLPSTTLSSLEDLSEPTILVTPSPSGLRSVDMIIIIVVSIIGGLLIVIIIALIIHECRRRSHTKSFDLRGTPRPHIHTEDFTLTKMERGPAEYNDYGLVVNSTSNGHTRTPQVGVATIVETPNHHNGDAMHNGYHKAGKEQYEPEYDVGPDSPSISLMKSMRMHDTEGGIENPSFSSEDILDSGTETDKEMVSSDKGLDSPDHAPLDVYPAAESDSGRQSDSLTEIPYDTPPQHSPRSNLSDNTGSDHTYEAYEAPPTPDIPQSPTHHEVLMPIEEVDYPNEETKAPSPPQSPGSPDVLSHSPEHGSYEMVETRSPGKRESDFFAPAEGATAF